MDILSGLERDSLDQLTGCAGVESTGGSVDVTAQTIVHVLGKPRLSLRMFSLPIVFLGRLYKDP